MPQPRILVAEDDRYMAALVRQSLEGQGMTVTLAKDGEDALYRADSDCPDLVILDVSMPVLNGLEVLRTLKADRFHRNTPVLMLTATRSETDVRSAISHGAADFITKPFRPDQLVRRVKRILSGPPSGTHGARSGAVEDLDGDDALLLV